tara:strand:+ start:164 stop:451 length:288 start_codon:yes stop_codon:yes gene_type:complete
MELDDKLDLILLKVKDMDKKIDLIQETVEAHRLEHGFQKMQDGGINSNFGEMAPQGPPTGMPPGMGGGMGQGYQMPGMGAPMGGGGADPSRPPGM